jgi:hypothetical protein
VIRCYRGTTADFLEVPIAPIVGAAPQHSGFAWCLPDVLRRRAHTDNDQPLVCRCYFIIDETENSLFMITR